MADDVYTTLLNFVSESSEANRDIKQTTDNLGKMEAQAKRTGEAATKSLGNISFPGDDLSSDFDAFTKAFDKSFTRVKDKLVDLRTGTKAVSADLRKFSESSAEDLKKINLSGFDVEKIKADAKKLGVELSEELTAGLASGNLTQEDVFEVEGLRGQVAEIQAVEEARKRDLKTAILAHNQKASFLRAEAALLSNQATAIQRNAQVYRNQAQQLQGVSQLALGAGVGIVGGIFAAANRYVRDAKEATEVTIKWKAAQDSIGKSGQKVGAVLAQTALPLLVKVADVAAKAAGFLEKHPELAQAAINVGLVTAGLGAVGIAVSKGIKLYADQLYLSSIPLQLQAGQLQAAAGAEQLAAAKLNAKTAGIDIASGDGGVPAPAAASGSLISSILAPLTLIVVGVIVAKYAVDLVNIVLEKTGASKAIADAQKKILETSARPYPGIITGARPGAGASAESAVNVPTGVRASNQFEQILRAYEDYKRDDLVLVQRHYADRKRIVEDSLQAELKANAQYASDVRRVNDQRSHSISEATRAYELQSTQAEQQNATQRAQIVRDGGIEIQRIEENLQENLRKLRKDHEERLEALVASRDALGILKEQENYQSERSEQTRQANIEIRQRRADLAIRLADLQQNFLAEREQRYAEFKARLAEINANAAQQLKELAARHQEELAQIRQQRIDRIKELDAQFKEERARRREYLLDQIRELDAGLLGEAALRKQRQDEMIAELDRFLLQYNSAAASIAQQQALATVRAKGGYATYGTYLLGDKVGGGRGKPEYVLNGNVTELAERVLGGQLSQDKFASLLSAMNGGSRGNSVIYNDSRRIDSRISNEDRERMVDDTFSVLEKAME